MDPIASPWKITHDPTGTPLILVDYDQLLGDGIEFPWKQVVQSSPRTRAANQRYFGRGNAETDLTFTVFKTHADLATLLAYCINHQIAIAALAKKDVRVDIAGGGKWKLADAVIESTVPRWAHERGPMTVTSYTIRGSGWAVIP